MQLPKNTKSKSLTTKKNFHIVPKQMLKKSKLRLKHYFFES